MITRITGLLAQATTQANGGPSGPGGGSAPAGGFPTAFWGLILAMIVFYVVLFRGQGKRQKELNKLVSALKKNDRVVTVGGIVGTVVSTRDDEVVVRVDESSNTKLTFVRKSIQRVITEGSSES